MNEREVLGKLLDHKKAAVLRIVLNSPEELCLKEVAHKSKVSMASTFRILQELVMLGIVRRRVWKTSKVYGCEQNEKADFLKGLFEETFDGAMDFATAIQEVQGIQQVILHGGKRKGKANVLIIGQGVDAELLELAKNSLRDRGFDLSYLTLTQKQYDQMLQMGLYQGEKKVLRGG